MHTISISQYPTIYARTTTDLLEQRVLVNMVMSIQILNVHYRLCKSSHRLYNVRQLNLFCYKLQSILCPSSLDGLHLYTKKMGEVYGSCNHCSIHIVKHTIRCELTKIIHIQIFNECKLLFIISSIMNKNNYPLNINFIQ